MDIDAMRYPDDDEGCDEVPSTPTGPTANYTPRLHGLGVRLDLGELQCGEEVDVNDDDDWNDWDVTRHPDPLRELRCAANPNPPEYDIASAIEMAAVDDDAQADTLYLLERMQVAATTGDGSIAAYEDYMRKYLDGLPMPVD